MQQLVRQVRAVPHLPLFICRYVTTLNTLAIELEQLELPNGIRERLQELLAMRRVLLLTGRFGEASMNLDDDRPARDGRILDEICQSHTSVTSFCTLPYEQLRSRYLYRCTPGQHTVLRELWIGEDDLRRLVEKYDVPLEILDWFSQQNVTAIRLLNRAHKDQLVAFTLEQLRKKYVAEIDLQEKQGIVEQYDKFKANLRNLYANEVLGRATDYAERIKHHLENINNATEELNLIDRTALDDKTSLRQQLTSIGSRLQINWHFSKEELDNADDLLDLLIGELRIFRESLLNGASNKCPTDEELVACVNGGAALHGMQFIKPEAKIFRLLLAPPVFVTLEEPSMSSIIKELTFSSLAESEKFLRTIQTCGLSTVMKNFDDHSLVQTSQLVKLRCHVIPVHSIQITKEQMKLSLEARTALNLVTDFTTARKFLSDFGSHISEGTQHVGGIFIHQLSAQTNRTISSEELASAVVREWDASCAPGYRTHRCHLPSSTRPSYEAETEPIISMEHSVQSIGPACENLELFQNMLTTHHSSWFLIDRGPASSLIPVWEIIDQLCPSDPTMQETAQLLKLAWLMDASDCLLSESLLCEIDRVRLLQPTPARYLQEALTRVFKVSENTPELVNQLNEQIDAISINMKTMTDDQCLEKVRVNPNRISK